MNIDMKRVLIVEDNALLAYDLVDLLEECGIEPVGPAMNLASGLQLVGENHLDAALLDIELGAERVWPLADMLAGHGTPYAFVSGQCKQDQLPGLHADRVCLEKPASKSELMATLADLLEAA